MSTTTHQMKFEIALSRATALVLQLEPFCNKIHIAGSVRRERPFCNDIEIVCEPKPHFMNDFNSHLVHDDNFGAMVHKLGKVLKGDYQGKYMQLECTLEHEYYIVDIFMPNAIDYYRIFAIRTGSNDYSKRIASAWVRNGWCGSDAGMRKIKDCEQNKHGKWICKNLQGDLPPVWQSEQEFFNWLHLPYLEPKHREV